MSSNGGYNRSQPIRAQHMFFRPIRIAHFTHVTYVTSQCPYMVMKFTWPHGIKNTHTQELNSHSWHSFNEPREAWWQAGHVWRPSDVTPFTNLITNQVHLQFSRSHKDNWIGWLPRLRACRTPTHTALRAVPLEFVSFPSPVGKSKG